MKHVNEPMPDVQKQPARGLLGAGGGRRASDRQGPQDALPGHGRRAWPTSRRPWRSRWRAPAAPTARRPPCSTRCRSERRILTTRRVSAAGIFLVLAATAAALLIAALTGRNGEHTPNAVAPAGGDPAEEREDVRSFDPRSPSEEHNDERSSSRSTATRHRLDDRDLPGTDHRERSASRASAWSSRPTKPVAARTMTHPRGDRAAGTRQIYGSPRPPAVARRRARAGRASRSARHRTPTPTRRSSSTRRRHATT